MLSVLTLHFSRLRTWLFGQKEAANNTEPALSASAEPIGSAPAVAGFVLRFVAPVDFQLSARLASVAHLNTRAGRTPHQACQRRPNTKSIPKSTSENRKRSKLQTTMPQARAVVPAPRKSAAIIKLPTANNHRVPLDVRIARAA